jgi:hypothetical protein
MDCVPAVEDLAGVLARVVVGHIQELQQAVASVHQRGRGVERVMGPEDGRLEKETRGYE